MQRTFPIAAICWPSHQTSVSERRANHSVVCRIIIRLRQTTFRCIKLLNRQNRHALPHNFSLQCPTVFSKRLALANSHFRQTHEKLCGRDDTASEALSMHRAKRIVSETLAFASSRAASSVEKTAICRLEKLCGRSHQLSYSVDQPVKRIDSKPTKSYKSEKRNFIRQSTHSSARTTSTPSCRSSHPVPLRSHRR